MWPTSTAPKETIHFKAFNSNGKVDTVEIWFALDDVQRNFTVWTSAVERMFAFWKELKADAAKRENVDGQSCPLWNIYVITVDQFKELRSHVVEGAFASAERNGATFIGSFAQTKVGDFEQQWTVWFLREKNVGWFDVSMDQFSPVNVAHSSGHLIGGI